MDSLVGKEITGRSIPGYDVYGVGPASRVARAEAPRRLGKPLTTAERQQQHLARYGTNTLPKRGTGLRLQQQQLGPDLGSFVAGMALGFIIGGLLLTATGRKIGYRVGERVARRI